MTAEPVSMAQAFTVELGARVHDGLGVVGRFGAGTGKEQYAPPCFVGATSAGLIVVHDPSEQDVDRAVRHHNVNRPLTALDTVAFGQQQQQPQQQQHQSLLLGSPASLLVFDIHNNADVFYKEVPDGVNTVASGTIYQQPSSSSPTASSSPANGAPPGGFLYGDPSTVALVGGNGSVQGYNNEGQESWWTVAGDNVGAVAVLPTSVASSIIAVGTDDFEIRTYMGESLTSQVTETDRVTRLKPAPRPVASMGPAAAAAAQTTPAQLAYALSNGTIGIYDFPPTQQPHKQMSMARRWRYKSKNHPNSLAFGDVNFDGVPELLVGWSNGRFEVRATGAEGRSGEVVFKETLAAPVAAVAAADYRRTQRDVPVVATNSGELIGFVPVEGAGDSIIAQSQHLERLTEQKAALEHELAAAAKQSAEMEAQLAAAQQDLEKASHSSARELEMQQSSLQENVDVRASLLPCADKKRLELTVSVTGSGSAIQSVLVHADVVFGAADTIFLANPNPGTHSMSVNISTVKDLQCELQVVVTLSRPTSAAALAASGTSHAPSSPSDSASSRHFFEVRRFVMKLPKFVMYCPLRAAPADGVDAAKPPRGYVSCKISERAGRLSMWAQSSFVGFGKIGGGMQKQHKGGGEDDAAAAPTFEAWFQSLRQPDHKVVGVVAHNDGELRVHCDDTEIAGDFLQDLAAYMSVGELAATAHFPDEFGTCAETIDRAESMNQARLKLTAEMADVAQLVKALVVKIEDARTLGDVKTVRRTLDSLYEVNNELLGEHLKRSTNHAELLGAMKSVNFMIQKASRLRVGEEKKKVVDACRGAVKQENMKDLLGIFEKGHL